jgi:hypothetical protein
MKTEVQTVKLEKGSGKDRQIKNEGGLEEASWIYTKMVEPGPRERDA